MIIFPNSTKMPLNYPLLTSTFYCFTKRFTSIRIWWIKINKINPIFICFINKYFYLQILHNQVQSHLLWFLFFLIYDTSYYHLHYILHVKVNFMSSQYISFIKISKVYSTTTNIPLWFSCLFCWIKIWHQYFLSYLLFLF